MKNKIEVSAIIPTYERKECLKDLLESIFRSNYPRKKMEIIVVDDNSNEPYEEIKEGIPSVKFLKNKESKWVSRCRNIGAKVSKGKYLLFIDDDNLLDEGCISELVKFLNENPSAAVVMPAIFYHSMPETIWCCGAKTNHFNPSFTNFKRKGEKVQGNLNSTKSDTTPSAFMIRRKVFYKVGGFDSKRFPIHFEETDLCKRTKKYGEIYCYPKAKAWHRVNSKNLKYHQNKEKEYFKARSRVLFIEKHATSAEKIFLLLILPGILLSRACRSLLYPSEKKSPLAYLKGCIDAFKEVLFGK